MQQKEQLEGPTEERSGYVGKLEEMQDGPAEGVTGLMTERPIDSMMRSGSGHLDRMLDSVRSRIFDDQQMEGAADGEGGGR